MILLLFVFVIVCLALACRPRPSVSLQDGEAIKPYRSRWYSGGKRFMLSLLAANFLLPVAIVLAGKCPRLMQAWEYCGECLMVLAFVLCLLALIWGVVRPREYVDGKSRSGVSCIVGLFGLSVVLALTMMTVGAIAVFQMQSPGKVDITLPAYSAAEFKRHRAQYVAKRLVPEGGTDIRMTWNRGAFIGGSWAEFRCTCTQEALGDFARENGYVFQKESISRNDCPEKWPRNFPKDVDFIHSTWQRYHDAEDCPGYPTKFLAYNCRYPSCRGFSFLYDMENQVLYGSWASN